MSINSHPLVNTNPDSANRSSITSAISKVILDADAINSSFLVQTGGNVSMYIDRYANVGINTTSPGAQLEVASVNGACFRIRYGSTTAHADIFINSSGFLSLNPSGGELNTSGNLNIFEHNGSTIGLKLGGTLITATANKINYIDTTPGTASASKAVVLDSNKDLSGIRNLGLTGTLSSGTMVATVSIATTSGGTGTNTYALGDILTGTNTNTLTKLSAPGTLGYLLSSNSTAGTYWGYNYLTTYYVGFPMATILSSSTYTFGPFFGRDSTGQQDIAITAATTSINLNISGLNGVGFSANAQTGTIYPTPLSTTITGISTLFLTDIGTSYVVINIGLEARKVVQLISNTSAVIDTPFTILNTWTLGATGSFTTTAGQFKFGSAAFNGANATTSYALLTIGSPNRGYITSSSNQWTVEFWLRPTALAARVICASATANTFRINLANNGTLSLSLGQGTTFNIANGSAITGSITASTYVHIAVVFNGSAYTVYKNGTSSLVVSSSLPLTSTCFDQFYVGSDTNTAFNGQIDEFRLSSIARYATTFSVGTSAFTYDTNTMSLNHFENTSSITLSDECSTSFANTQFSYYIDNLLGANTVYYGYAISDLAGQSGYIFNSNSIRPQLPAGYTHFAPIPFYATTNNAGSWIATNYSGMGSIMGGCYQYMVHIPVIANATNVSPTFTNTVLSNYIPTNANKVILLITHMHAGTTSAGIIIGHNSLSMLNTIMTVASAGGDHLTYTLPLATMSFDTCLSAAASSTNYSISIIGFYT